MLKRFYSSNHKQLESAIYIIGHAATRLPRTVNAEVNLRKIVQNGPKALNDNLLSRKISPTRLIGSSNFLGIFYYKKCRCFLILRTQSFTFLMADFCQDINGRFAFSRCFNGTLTLEGNAPLRLW